MAFKVVEEYYRKRQLDFFRGYRVPFYSLTLSLDATEVKRFAESGGWSVYLNLCYFFSRAMQGIDDFRYRLIDDQIVLYDRLDVAATLPAPDGTFSFGYFDYHPDAELFNLGAAAVVNELRGRSSLAERDHSNWILFTALPKVPFTGFTHARPDDTTDGRPRVAFGRFIEREGRLMVPVGLEVNHLYIDGAALGELVEGVEEEFAQPR
jgi:chloramphenicol O-acetyltransferase type A